MNELVSRRSSDCFGRLLETQPPKAGRSPAPPLGRSPVLDAPKCSAAIAVMPVGFREVSHRLAWKQPLSPLKVEPVQGGVIVIFGIPGSSFRGRRKIGESLAECRSWGKMQSS